MHSVRVGVFSLFYCSSCLFKSSRLPTWKKKKEKTTHITLLKPKARCLQAGPVPAYSRKKVAKVNLKDILQWLFPEAPTEWSWWDDLKSGSALCLVWLIHPLVVWIMKHKNKGWENIMTEDGMLKLVTSAGWIDVLFFSSWGCEDILDSPCFWCLNGVWTASSAAFQKAPWHHCLLLNVGSPSADFWCRWKKKVHMDGRWLTVGSLTARWGGLFPSQQAYMSEDYRQPVYSTKGKVTVRQTGGLLLIP